MASYIIPNVGSSGFFQLSAPLDTLITSNEKYICKSLRKLSDYFASNENPKADIYDKYGIDEAIYNDDLANDTIIASLQSDKGHWLYIPVRFFVSYPDPNGIQYRTMGLGISLPSIPVDKDLSFLITDLKNLVMDSLGVSCEIKPVETSRIMLVTSEDHTIISAQRDMNINGMVTDRSKYMSTLSQLDSALLKIQELEAYIAAHL